MGWSVIIRTQRRCGLCICTNTHSNMCSFGLLACTRAACPADSLDTQFEAALGSVSSYRIDTSLFLNYEGGVMRFLAPVATPLQ